ncbi:MAG: hypothetical protein IPL39_08025 [Opitutaceae bacterium]|nr:hypothetical protein [Opitutaceae bacterium]
MDYQGNIWTQAYPNGAAIPNDRATFTDLTSDGLWLAPGGCRFIGNLGWRSSPERTLLEVNSRSELSASENARWIGSVRAKIELGDNLVDVDPLFVDEAAGDLNLHPGSPVSAIPSWQTIPCDQIGIRE